MATNPKNKEIVNQINNAFDFMQKLYHESSYLIKEIEGQLGESDYRFKIIKPGGYGVTSRSSSGLESNNVNYWLMRKLSVAFVEGSDEEIKKSQNITIIDEELKVLYFRVVLNEKGASEPFLIFGVFYSIKQLKEWVKKFEQLMGVIEYTDKKLFDQFPNIDYQDATFRIKGKFKRVDLLDINSSTELIEKVINPAIKLYERID
ncbi:MAG: hypothetical protein ABFS32_20715 [Bacteroidota bacterium]